MTKLQQDTDGSDFNYVSQNIR